MLEPKVIALLKNNDQPVLSAQGINFLKTLLSNDPIKRTNATNLLNHNWFKKISELI